MGTTHVRLKGDKQLKAQLRRLGRAGPAAGDEALDKWARLVRNDARSSAPVGPTGALQNAIEARRPSASQAQVGVWDPDVYYSIFVENGTSSQAAQPYLGPAFDRARRAVRRLVAAELQRRVGR